MKCILTVFLPVLFFASCDVYYHVKGIVVDAETGQRLDTFTVYHINKTYPDTTIEAGHRYINHYQGFEASKMTGWLKPEPLHLKIAAPGYELLDLPNLKGRDTLVVKMKRIK